MIVTGLLALATGIAYTALGVITVYELIRHRRDRGFSHFGLSFAVMAFTCGPHHLVHAYRHLVAARARARPDAGRAGDRRRPRGRLHRAAPGGRVRRPRRPAGPQQPRCFAALPWVMAAAAGATLWEALRHAAAMDVDLRALLPNVFLFVNYVLVGYFTARTQLARRPLLDGWSLSGRGDERRVPHLRAVAPGRRAADRFEPRRRVLRQHRRARVDLLHVGRLPPATRDSERDWNRRPLVGRAAPLGRRSPWAEANS